MAWKNNRGVMARQSNEPPKARKTLIFQGVKRDPKAWGLMLRKAKHGLDRRCGTSKTARQDHQATLSSERSASRIRDAAQARRACSALGCLIRRLRLTVIC
jgi:hypothetical protein